MDRVAEDGGVGRNPEGPDGADARSTRGLAPDGSPVAFYRRLPAQGEPELIHAAVGANASILDIGCGPGRIAAPLAALGHRVTGVDDGAGMIGALPAAVEGVVADATRVRLGRRFDAVLLASHLINDPKSGRAFLATAAAHLDRGGLVVGQTYPPGWAPDAARGGVRRIGDATVELIDAHLTGDLFSAEVEYGVDGQVWRQSFSARILDEPELQEALALVGLEFERWLDRPGWFVARRG
jgi:SAM-dependent methyltransferase